MATKTKPVSCHRGRQPRNLTRRMGFTRFIQGGPPAHHEASKRARQLGLITMRQQRAWDLFTAGATFQQVGDALGVSNKTAWEDCVAVKRQLPVLLVKECVLIRARQLARLDGVHRAHWPKRHQKPHADVLLKVYEREAKLLGLDAPTKITPTDPSGERPYMAWTLEELERAVREREGRLGLRAAVDVLVAPSGDGDESG